MDRDLDLDLDRDLDLDLDRVLDLDLDRVLDRVKHRSRALAGTTSSSPGSS